MISIYYMDTSPVPCHSLLISALSGMPAHIRDRVLRYRSVEDQLPRIAAKLMLLQHLKDFKLDKELTLAQIDFTPLHRPFFHHAFDFNTAHSGHFALCAASLDCHIGIDIEQVQHPDIEDFVDYFSPQEIEALRSTADPILSFYRLWTRKEAVVKAIGAGVDFDWRQLHVHHDHVIHAAHNYQLIDLNIREGYISSLASDRPSEISMHRFELSIRV